MLKLTGTTSDQSLWVSCAAALDTGGLALVPMETVYGVLGRVDLASTVRRLRSLRSVPDVGPMTVHVARASDALAYVDPPAAYGRHLMEKLWPGPVGLMFAVSQERQAEIARKIRVAPEDLFERGHITLRCPDHVSARSILAHCHHPIVAVAPPGEASRLEGIKPEVLEQLDMVLDEGPTRYAKPSTILQVGRDHFDIVRPGVYDRRIIEKALHTTILFVCSGNTCRSPMAQGIARDVLARHLVISPEKLEKAGYTIVSAGLMAFGGSPAANNAVEALDDMGIDISRHRSRPLGASLLQQADVIFAMGQSHVDAIARMDPHAAKKAQTLDPNGDIDDPIGGELSLYQSLAREMQSLIKQRLADGSLTGTEKQP